jgi:hypothetical protein
MEDEDQQEVVWARFCALYLPDTVERYLNPPPLPSGSTDADADFITDYKTYNAYLEMLVQIQHSPYFAKYLRSRNAVAVDGKRLPGALAARVLEQSSRWDRLMLTKPRNRPELYYESAMESCLQLLSTLLAAFVKVEDQEAVVPMATRQALLPWLIKWTRRYSNNSELLLGSVAHRVWAQLSPEVDIKDAVKQVRRTHKNWDACAMPLCSSKADNKACGR